MWARRRRLVRPGWNPTCSAWPASADTLRSFAEDTAALSATSPPFAAHRGFQVLQEPARAAPDPKGPFLPESNHLLFPSCPRVWSNRGRANSNAHLEVYGLGCCPYTMPRQSSKAQNTRAFALNTLGSPPRAVSVCSSWRCGSWSLCPTVCTYFNVAATARCSGRPIMRGGFAPDRPDRSVRRL